MPYKNLEDKKSYQKEYFKKYRSDNKDRLNALKREWRKRNIEKMHEKENAYSKKYRALYPERFKEYDRKNHKKQLSKIRTWLLRTKIEHGGMCTECGYKDEPRILHFHHLRDKDRPVSTYNTLEQIQEEAQKCILLCPNCHALEHLC